MNGIFNASIFNNQIFNVGANTFGSNWQADYWKHGARSKKQREEAELEERIRLGILPEPLAEEAQQAVEEADLAARQLSSGELSASEAILVGMEAREAYEQAYMAAYKEAYISSVVAELWKADMKKLQRRRKAIALLLH